MWQFRSGFALAPVILFCAVACAGDGTGPSSNNNNNGGGNNGGGTPTFSADIQPIFTSNCALSGCHAASSPQQGQNLSAGQAYANIVNVQSMEVPTLLRVKPGAPDESYLVHKIQGTQGTVGGTGGQMPLGGTPLSAAQIATIRAWITAGAQNN